MAKKEIDNEPMLEETSDEILLEETSGTEAMLEETSDSEVLLEEDLSESVLLEEDSDGLLEEAVDKATKKAAKTVAFPGKSEHNLGLAVDMNSTDNGFEKTTAYKWLSKHAHEYGFIERYKSDKMEHTGVIYEPWHYRYVGKKYAKYLVTI